MKSQQLWFTGPHSVEVREKELEVSGARDVLVRNVCSAISAGTEMLVFRNQLPDSLALDESIEALSGQAVQYPLQYGYACVGKVEAIGEDVEPDWFGKTVFFVSASLQQFCCQPGGPDSGAGGYRSLCCSLSGEYGNSREFSAGCLAQGG